MAAILEKPLNRHFSATDTVQPILVEFGTLAHIDTFPRTDR